MHITADVPPRPLDRLWLRWKPKATQEQKLALRDKYGIKP